MVDDDTLLELIRRIESMEMKLSAPEFNKPHGTCMETITILSLNTQKTNLMLDELIDKWIWLAINTIATSSIFVDEINGLRKKLGLGEMTKEELSKKMEKIAPHAEKQLSELMKRR